MVSLCASRLGATQPMGSTGGGRGVGAGGGVPEKRKMEFLMAPSHYRPVSACEDDILSRLC